MNQQNVDHILQQLRVQKRRLQQEKIELESAREELEGTSESWRIIGNLMVKKKPQALQKDLDASLEQVTTRLGMLEQQEEQLRKQVADEQE